MNIKETFLRIPLQYRSAAYSGPFFVIWILGYAIEQGERAKTAAGRGLVLLLLFLGYHAVVLLGFEIVKSFVNASFVLDVIHFTLKSVGGLAYLFVGGYLAIGEVRNAPASLPALDGRARTVESILTR